MQRAGRPISHTMLRGAVLYDSVCTSSIEER